METDNRLPSGEWNGFYLESHQPKRGWMHLYMSFKDGRVTGEGTDYVGPWVARGEYDLESGICHWEKSYVGKHKVVYSGVVTDNGIQGQWELSFLSGAFHIWPKGFRQFDEMYLQEDLTQPAPSVLLEPVLDERSV